jgi:membrane dipeptidase
LLARPKAERPGEHAGEHGDAKLDDDEGMSARRSRRSVLTGLLGLCPPLALGGCGGSARAPSLVHQRLVHQRLEHQPSAPQRASHAVTDLHVDLAAALEARPGALVTGEASLGELGAGGVARLVVPLTVPRAHGRPPAALRDAYARAEARLSVAIDGSGGALALGPVRPLEPGAPIAVTLALEGAEGFVDAPRGLVAMLGRGLRLVGLVHARTNALAGASQEPDPGLRTGLTPAGRALVEATYAAGGLVDLAHLSSRAFADVAALARAHRAPLVVSHTGVRALRDIERNLSDAELEAVAASGGCVGISLHAGHVGRTPGEPASLDDVALALTHAVRVAGPSAVSLGSDLEGGIELPRLAQGRAATGASVFPLLLARLSELGVAPPVLNAIAASNAERVLLGGSSR